MNPLVSVLVITYQHEHYIHQCLESVLSQKTDFDFEIVIGDDCSKDRTPEILHSYQARDPRIRLVVQPTNTGGAKNFRDALEACRGEWIAWCEGDDYWIDDRKLQMQMDLIRKEPKAALSFARAKIWNQRTLAYETDTFPSRSLVIPPRLERQDLLYGNIVPTCTAVFKKSAVWPLPDWYGQWPLGDWTLYLWALRKGAYAVFLDEESSGYRTHPQGMWSSLSKRQAIEKLLPLLRFMVSNEPLRKDRRRLTSNLFAQESKLLILDIREKKIGAAFNRFGRVLKLALQSEWSLRRLAGLTRKAGGF